MALIKLFAQEMKHEAATTRRVLEVVPEEHFAWKPHEKSMSLGRLAGHIAEIPGWGPDTLQADFLDLGGDDAYQPFHPATRAELLAGHDRALETFFGSTQGVTDEDLSRNWQLRMGDHIAVEAPKAAILRSFILSHVVHHRGQMSVFLRLLDVPVPSVYGPSADDPGSFG
ncbi:MAG: DinB family protein [Acidobacteriota bacterium]